MNENLKEVLFRRAAYNGEGFTTKDRYEPIYGKDEETIYLLGSLDGVLQVIEEAGLMKEYKAWCEENGF